MVLMIEPLRILRVQCECVRVMAVFEIWVRQEIGRDALFSGRQDCPPSVLSKIPPIDMPA